ncbi:hypothetical protein G155_00089 [Mycobacterium sp. VKM Ac-1817D]|nr:hypothetical protein G155_00089 [Mycobacterium sp. VKM Ac-1817D]
MHVAQERLYGCGKAIEEFRLGLSEQGRIPAEPQCRKAISGFSRRIDENVFEYTAKFSSKDPDIREFVLKSAGKVGK